MGMGAMPCHGWTISQEHLQALLPEAWRPLQEALERHGVTLDAFAQAIDQEVLVGGSKDAAAELEELLHQLYQQFHAKTTVDESFLELELMYYDAGLGSAYDELESGANWAVRGVRHYTPAGEAFRDKVERKSWTVYC